MEKVIFKTAAELNKLFEFTGLDQEGGYAHDSIAGIVDGIEKELNNLNLTQEKRDIAFSKRYAEEFLKAYDYVFVGDDGNLYGVKGENETILLDGNYLKDIYLDALTITQGSAFTK